MFRFSQRSYDKLAGVRPELVAVATLALSRSPVDFGITEGLRTKKRQRELYNEGKSRTMNSRHLTGHAIDVAAYVDGKVTWDWQSYLQISQAMKHAAEDLGVNIQWGDEWQSLKDGPHFELI